MVSLMFKVDHSVRFDHGNRSFIRSSESFGNKRASKARKAEHHHPADLWKHEPWMEPWQHAGCCSDRRLLEQSAGSRAYFDDIRDAGFKSVRIPVTWDSHIGSAPEYPIDTDWMNRVEEVTDWALEREFTSC
ncbi:cellulase family glycosylhydrolase [Bacillus licheniformis]|nr:cellulase family glycosylhydrolase [Bacillus licheniformis]